MSKLIPLLFCFTIPYAAALSTDPEQPIYIDSDSQNLDMKSNTVIFTGNVFLRQGSIRLKAQKIIVRRAKNSEGSEIIEATGSPATFQQTMDNGKLINGQALDVQYDVGSSLLKMTTKALLLQEGGNKIEGKKITYNIDKQLLIAESDGSSRVTTVLQPQKRK